MENHNKFMKDVEYASSLPAQTAHHLSPESQEDFAVYTKDEVKK